MYACSVSSVHVRIIIITGTAAALPSQNSADLSTKSSHTLDVAKGNTGNMVSCTILLNDMEKKCDLLLQGNQQNCIDENFSDKDKPSADESSNAVEFVYKKNRNSSVTKGGGSGGGGGGGAGSGKSRQKQNYGNSHTNWF